VTTATIGVLFPPGGDIPDLWRALRNLGWRRGDNLKVEYRAGVVETYSALATELVRLGVSMIVTMAEGPTRAARDATESIPIVMVSVSDAVAAGLVTSLSRPGGNITGLSLLGPEMRAKNLELLRELVPGLSRVAVLWHPSILDALREYTRIQQEAEVLGIQVLSVEAGNAREVPAALERIRYGSPGALIVENLGSYSAEPAQSAILSFADSQKVPTVYATRFWVEAGGLMSYGPRLEALDQAAAVYIDKILRGAKPADLPVQQPTVFDLVIRASRLKVLGLPLPPSIVPLVTEWVD
jgi:putative ABC transport system substrate-binding protein